MAPDMSSAAAFKMAAMETEIARLSALVDQLSVRMVSSLWCMLRKGGGWRFLAQEKLCKFHFTIVFFLLYTRFSSKRERKSLKNGT